MDSRAFFSNSQTLFLPGVTGMELSERREFDVRFPPDPKFAADHQP